MKRRYHALDDATEPRPRRGPAVMSGIGRIWRRGPNARIIACEVTG